MKYLLHTLPLLILAVALPAAPMLAATAADEIEALLDFVEASGCEFVRNGTAHDSAEGRSHLERKLAYLRDHGGVATAEEFIAKAATKSSTSGRPYAVRCAGAPEQPSATWLEAELARMRASSAAAGTPAP